MAEQQSLAPEAEAPCRGLVCGDPVVLADAGPHRGAAGFVFATHADDDLVDVEYPEADGKWGYATHGSGELVKLPEKLPLSEMRKRNKDLPSEELIREATM